MNLPDLYKKSLGEQFSDSFKFFIGISKSRDDFDWFDNPYISINIRRTRSSSLHLEPSSVRLRYCKKEDFSLVTESA